MHVRFGQGIGLDAPFETTSEELFDRLVNIHFKGVFFLTQKLLPIIADGGRIVNLSSGLARVALPGFAVYGALKGAIEVLTRYLAKELGERKIAVNVVAPGGIETDFGGGALRDIPEVNAFIASQTALGRRGARRYRTCYRGAAVPVPSLDKRSAYRSVRGMGALSLSAARGLDRTR